MVPNRVPEYFEQVLINTFSHSVKFPFDQSVMSRRISSTSFGPVLLKSIVPVCRNYGPAAKIGRKEGRKERKKGGTKEWKEGRIEGEKEERKEGRKERERGEVPKKLGRI